MFNDYKVPDGHVFIENELIDVNKHIKPLIENYTSQMMGTLASEFIDYLIFGVRKIKQNNVRQFLAISFLAIPFMNSVLVKGGAKVETLIKSNGFSLGLVGGASIAYSAYAESQSVPFKKQIIQWLATEGLMYTLKSNPKLNMILYMTINKVAISLFKMPDHEISLGDFLMRPKSLYSPKELVRSFLVSLLTGFILGFFVFRYTYKKLFKTNANLVQIFMNKLKGGVREIGIAALTDDFKSLISPLREVKIKPKSVKEFVKFYQTYILSTEYKVKNSRSLTKNVATEIDFRKHKIHHRNLKAISNPQESQLYQHAEKTIEQAVYLLRDLVGSKLFDSSVNNVYIILDSFDNAFVKLSDTNRKKCDIYIVMNRNISKSVWTNFSVREIAAILGHEFGHFYGGAFSLLPAVKVSYIAVSIAKSLFNDQIIEILSESAIAYSTISFAKMAEIQADAFAIKLGLGKELHSALEQMVSTETIIDEFGQLTTHGGNLSRLRGIKKWTAVYAKLKKQAQ